MPLVGGNNYDWPPTLQSLTKSVSTCKVKVSAYTITNVLVGSDLLDYPFTITP